MANNMIEKINERYNDDSFLGLSEVFDSAIIGVEENEMRLIYSVSKCLKVFEEDMTKLDAIEYFNFNVGSAYVGEKTPIWCWDNF
tara:strand:+ start:1319 stop:1573 length:255 start_codon:yes stop_codon:yes gene_type:complete